MTGHVLALARRPKRLAPMELLDRGDVTVDAGLVGDYKDTKHRTRQVSVLALEDWKRALSEFGADAEHLPWTERRANILIEGLRLPRAKGAMLQLGDCELEVMGQTYPCHRMDAAYPGLLKALAPEWRGGVVCRVTKSGPVSTGDTVEILSSPPEIIRKLP